MWVNKSLFYSDHFIMIVIHYYTDHITDGYFTNKKGSDKWWIKRKNLDQSTITKYAINYETKLSLILKLWYEDTQYEKLL